MAVEVEVLPLVALQLVLEASLISMIFRLSRQLLQVSQLGLEL